MLGFETMEDERGYIYCQEIAMSFKHYRSDLNIPVAVGTGHFVLFSFP